MLIFRGSSSFDSNKCLYMLVEDSVPQEQSDQASARIVFTTTGFTRSSYGPGDTDEFGKATEARTFAPLARLAR